MSKIHLTGVDSNNVPLTPQNCEEEFDVFTGKGVKVIINLDGDYVLITDKGHYVLTEHQTNNYYHCIANQIRVQVSLKKMVGELRYWS